MAGLTAGLTLPGGVLAAHAQTTPVVAEALADGCGVLLLSDVPREVLLAVSWVPQEVVLGPVPLVEPSPTLDAGVEPSSSGEPEAPPEPAAEPTPSPVPSPDPSPSLDPPAVDPAVLAVGSEPHPVPLVPADGAGAEDAYRVVLTDAVTLQPILQVELPLPLCAAPDAVPSASPNPTPTGSPSPEASSETPGPTPLPDPNTPPAAAPVDPAPVTAASGSAADVTTPAPRSDGLRSFGRLSALRGTSRPGPPPVAVAPALPDLAPEPSGVPTPVVAYPPGTTGVVLPAPPDRPLAVLQPLLPGTGSPESTPPAQVVLTGAAPPQGITDALPPALLVAAAAAGFLGTQLRRRVPVRHH